MATQVGVLLEAQGEVRAQPQSYTGYLVRGLVYALLRSADPKFAEHLHSEKGLPAPFSVKPPHTLVHGKVRIFVRRIPANTVFSVQMTLLDDRLTELICKSLVNKEDGEIQLSHAKAKILSLTVKQIDSRHLQQKAPKSKRFAIRFLSPTFFRVHIPKDVRRTEKVRVSPLPDPCQMLLNLYNVWNAYMEPKVGEEYLEWLRQYPTIISRLKGIGTHRYYEHPVKGVFAIGFTGVAYYSFAEDTYDEEMARITHTLLKFGEYSNVGGNRTAGFGWIEVKYPEEKAKKDLTTPQESP